MGIKTKLILIGLLPLAMAVAFGLILYRGQLELGQLRDQVGRVSEMLDQLEQLESSVRYFVHERSDLERRRGYEILDWLDVRMLALEEGFPEGEGAGILAGMRRQLVQVRWAYMELDGLYLPGLTAVELTRVQGVVARLQSEVAVLKPLVHGLHDLSRRLVIGYSDELWGSAFSLILVSALGVMVLMYPLLYRIASALQGLTRAVRAMSGRGGAVPLTLGLRGDDEFAQLAREFSLMSRSLASAEAAREERARELEVAVRDLENFSYSVSHDLRAPLRAIDGFIRILEEEYGQGLDDEGRRLIGVVSDNARKMERLIDDILALSRAGRLEFEMVRVDMNALVDEVWADLAEQRAESGIRFERGSLPNAVCDPRAIRQVWANLLGNAIKFTSMRDHPLIQVLAEHRGDVIHYLVVDNGVGFDNAYSSKLFQLFQRLHGMNEFEGTGVGLAIVKRFVQRHEGQVDASGRKDGGATFGFTLPVRTEPESGEVHGHRRYAG
ncbi:sensor histidine kinase [Imhoffiella purpurea]|uniref:histidine kinase n=1 Tax=Imhoffiella purpurea TaxID=1249627 RepID=W9W2G3_9GAMM|nr:ATP-binding protein [Imhoffiella purpurea]EXJ16765.1 sensory transduction histidine kinase [Imhoffiella purpurea]